MKRYISVIFLGLGLDLAAQESSYQYIIRSGSDEVCEKYQSFMNREVIEKGNSRSANQRASLMNSNEGARYGLSIPGKQLDRLAIMMTGDRHELVEGVASTGGSCLSIRKLEHQNSDFQYYISDSSIFEYQYDTDKDEKAEYIVSTYADGLTLGCGEVLIYDEKTKTINKERTARYFWPLYVYSASDGVLKERVPGSSSVLFEWDGKIFLEMTLDVPLGPEFKAEGAYIYELSNEKLVQACFVEYSSMEIK